MINNSEKTLVSTFKGIATEENNINFFNDNKNKSSKKSKTIFLSSCLTLLLLAGFLTFARFHEIPLPFDSYRMSVELMPCTVVISENGEVSWKNLESAKSKGIVPDDYENVINVLHRNYQGINGISESSTGRTINRNGEDVRLVYYCYSKTLWNSLFKDPDLEEYSESGRSTGTDMYGDNYESLNYEPQMTEVYYLPLRDLYKINALSDTEYDSLRADSELIWRGTI